MSILTKRTAKRSFASVIAAAMIASVLALIAVPASAGTSVTMKRYSGIDRYATSALAATGAFATGSDNIVLVSGENYADGLAAAGLAGALAAPVLLTHPTTLLGSTANSIGTLDTGTGSAATALKVTIIGGVNAVSAGVATSLTGLGYTVERISGADRYATAVAVGDKLRALTTVGAIVGKTTAVLVSGTSFPDGLAAGGMAYLNKSPILLTNGTSLGASNTTFLNNEVNPIAQVVIIGGTAAVAEAVATEVKAIKNGLVAINVIRVSGADRYATALALAKFRAKSTVLQGNAETVTNIMLVSGENFADALSSAAKAGAAATMTLLSTASALDSATSTWVASKYATILNLFVTGGTSAISTATATAVKTAGTTVKVTATITANKGSKVVVVAYSSGMVFGNGSLGVFGGAAVGVGTGAGLAANYKINNGVMLLDAVPPANNDATNGGFGPYVADAPVAGDIQAPQCATSATTGKTTCHIFMGTALAVGDVVSVSGAAVSTVGSRVSTGATTVANEVVKPFVVSIDPIKIGAFEATFTMSEAVVGVTGAASANTLTHDDVTCGSDAPVTSIAKVTGNTYIAVFASALLATETCTIAASYKDVAGNAATVAKTSAAAQTDTTGSTITAKLTKTVNNGAITAGMGTGGTYKVAALATGAYKGPAGNAWSVQLIAGLSTSLPTVSVFDTVNKTIVVSACVATCSAGKQATAQNIVNVLNAHTDFGTNFLATVLAAANSTAVHNAVSLAGGTTTYDVVLTANEIMGETAADFRKEEFTGDADGAGTGTAGCAVTQDAADLATTPVATDWYKKVMNVTCTADATSKLITVGVSQMLVGANVKDFKGTVMTAAARKVIIQAG